MVSGRTHGCACRERKDARRGVEQRIAAVHFFPKHEFWSALLDASSREPLRWSLNGSNLLHVGEIPVRRSPDFL